jgi:hypothetical protein
MKHIKLFEDYSKELGVGDNTNVGAISDVTDTQFLINGTWYHKSIVKPSSTVVEPVRDVKPVLKKLDYEFAYTCVSPSSDEELEAIIDDMGENDTEVSIEEFLSVLPFEEISREVPNDYRDVEHLKSDYHVRYYIGEFYFDNDEDFNREMAVEDNEEYRIEDEGELIQYAVIVHSAIEHVWKVD